MNKYITLKVVNPPNNLEPDKYYSAQEVETLIEAMAHQQEVFSEYFIAGGKDESYSYYAYCEKCCQKEKERLDTEKPNNEYYIVFYPCGENDSFVWCTECRKLLSSTITAYGAEEELEGFVLTKLNFTSPNDCYSLRECLSALEHEYELYFRFVV